MLYCRTCKKYFSERTGTALWQYRLRDSSDLAVIEVAFVIGQESPTIKTADADFHLLAIQMRGQRDLGVPFRTCAVTRVEIPFSRRRGVVYPLRCQKDMATEDPTVRASFGRRCCTNSAPRRLRCQLCE